MAVINKNILKENNEHKAVGIDKALHVKYIMCMKRTNLKLDGEVLEEALHLAGVKTYSRVVDMALRDFIRRVKARRILELTGSDLWEGNLSGMREDRPRRRSQ